VSRLPKQEPYVIHTPSEIEGIRIAARATAEVLARLCAAVAPGMSTAQIDALAAEFIRDVGGESAFLGYRGFPGYVCVSVNDEVVHGIGKPDRILREGDIVSLDVGVRVDGFVGDSAETVPVGQSSEQALRLIETTREALRRGIAAARSGKYVNNIGAAVEKHVRSQGFNVVREFVGHGCGCQLHEPPEVPNYRRPDRGPRLRPGMVLAIEPMVNAGTARIRILDDGWTVRTADGSLSAHAEHMVLITRDEPEVLTCRKTRTA